MFTEPLSFLLFLDELPDPRQDAKILYPLPEMIFLAMCGAVANCDTWTDIEQYGNEHLDEFRQYIPLTNGIPSHDTFSRVFSRLDPVAFSECLIRWVDQLQLNMKGQGIHIDGKVLRERTVNGRKSEELTYFISSLPPKVRNLANQVRGHWKIENQMHWSLDVTFAEDTSRIRKSERAANEAIFRRLALMIVKRDRSEKLSMRLKRRKASWSFKNLLQYLTANPA